MLRFEPISNRALLQPMTTLEHKYHSSYIKRSQLVKLIQTQHQSSLRNSEQLLRNVLRIFEHLLLHIWSILKTAALHATNSMKKNQLPKEIAREQKLITYIQFSAVLVCYPWIITAQLVVNRYNQFIRAKRASALLVP